MKRFLLLAIALLGLYPSAIAQTSTKYVTPKGDTVTITVDGATVKVEPAPTPTPTPTPVPVVQKTPLGLNLFGPDEWSAARSWMFIDLYTTSRLIDKNKYRVLTTDDNDVYQKQADGTNKYLGKFGSKQPSIQGTYLLSWVGNATVTASGATIRNVFGNTAEVVITSDSVNVDLTFSAPITKFTMLRPGYPRGITEDLVENGVVKRKARTVTDEFIKYVAPFDTLRFMNLQETNWAFGEEPTYATNTLLGIQEYVRKRTLGFHGPVITGKAPVRISSTESVDLVLTFPLMNWEDRPSDTGSYHRQSGISFEAIARICEETGKSGWICLPPVFSDDLASGLAKFLKARSVTTTKWKIEVGNENPWNDIATFGQAKAIMAQADAAKATDPFIVNPPENPWYLGERFKLKRTVEAATIFEQEFGAAEFAKRIHFIVSGQNLNPSYMGNALNWGLRKYGNLDKIHGISFAPYIATDVGNKGGTVDQILTALNNDINNRYNVTSSLMKWRGIADAYGKKLYMYEGGVDLLQGIEGLANRIAVAYDPRMRATLKAYLDSCYNASGCEMLMYFQGIGTRSQWGPTWVLSDNVFDYAQPMYAAAVELTQQPASVGGLNAIFYKDTAFTQPLNMTPAVIPMVNHRWEAWSVGPIYGRKELNTTEAKNGAIRITGRYLGTAPLTVEKDQNDVATLTNAAGQIKLDYVAIFDKWSSLNNDGAGIAWVRLMAGGKPVPPGMFSLN